MKLLASLLERLDRQGLLKLQQDMIDLDFNMDLLSDDAFEVSKDGSPFKLKLSKSNEGKPFVDALGRLHLGADDFTPEHIEREFAVLEFKDAFKEPKVVDGCRVTVDTVVVKLFLPKKGFFDKDVSRSGVILNDAGQLKFKLFVKGLDGFCTYENLPLKSTPAEWAKIMVAQLKHQLK